MRKSEGLNEIDTGVTLEDLGGDWGLASDIPRELAQVIAEEFSEDDLERLAGEAVESAVGEISGAYMNPFVRQAANSAVRMALGLKPLPNKEGEQ